MPRYGYQLFQMRYDGGVSDIEWMFSVLLWDKATACYFTVLKAFFLQDLCFYVIKKVELLDVYCYVKYGESKSF